MAAHGTLRREGSGLTDRIEFRSQRPPVGCIGRQLVITNTSARLRAGVMPTAVRSRIAPNTRFRGFSDCLRLDNLQQVHIYTNCARCFSPLHDEQIASCVG